MAVTDEEVPTMKTIDAVRRNAVTVDSDRTIRAAAELMEHLGVGALVVTDDGRPVGVVTDRDLVRRGIARGGPGDARVDSMMSTPIVTIDAGTDLHDAFARFRSHGLRRLVVVDHGGAAVGMITVDDLLVDLSGDLAALARPVTGQVVFGQHDDPVPATR
jgi:predicted transcriptional regulator